MKLQIFIATLFFLFFSGCQKKQSQPIISEDVSGMVPAKGRIIPIDSVEKPEIVPIDEHKLKRKKAFSSRTVPVVDNRFAMGNPIVVPAGIPRIFTPGQEEWPMPPTEPAKSTTVEMGKPVILIAKDASVNDQNTFNFSYFNELQGLHNAIRDVIEDRAGNLWMATWGGGAIKYDGRAFTHYTMKEGLSDNYLWMVREDKAGNIWFCTQSGGVNRYDGENITHFTEKEGFSYNSVTCMEEDQQGRLWFGTDGGGVTMYDGESFTIYSTQQGLELDDVLFIRNDSAGNLWFGTDGQGLYRYDGKSFAQFTVNEGLSSNYVRSFHEDRLGHLWLGTLAGGGLIRYDGEKFTHYTENEGLPNNSIRCISEDDDGNLWLGTWGNGVMKFDGVAFSHFSNDEGISNDFVRSLLTDRHGNLWIGTEGGGLNKYNGRSFTQFTEEDGLSNELVRRIFEDKSGNLWICTWGGGVIKYDGRSFVHYREKDGLADDFVMAALEDRNGNLWFSSWSNGVTKYDGEFFVRFDLSKGAKEVNVSDILEDRQGHIWFSTLGDGIIKYDGQEFTHYTEKNGLSHNRVHSLLEDREGMLWIGTEGGGINKFDGQVFTHFKEKEGLSSNYILCGLEDSSGNLWFGTRGGGLNKFDGLTFTHFDETDGLSSNYIKSLVEDQLGNLWIGTEYGLNKMEDKYRKATSWPTASPEETEKQQKTDVYFAAYTYANGFLSYSCHPNAIFQDKSGKIWIGARDRLIVHHPEVQEFERDTIPPEVVLTDLQLYNEEVFWRKLEENKDSTFLLSNGVEVSNIKFEGTSSWYGVPRQLDLAYNNNYLTFHFVGITTHNPEKVKYQYQLSGLENSWNAITNRSSATYGNLPHGEYTFRVKAMNASGYWSDIYEYAFIINPPWWLTWWARTFYLMAPFLLFVVIYKARVAVLNARNAQLEEQVNERTAQLHQQNEELIELNREKDGIMGIVAHDLVSPFQRIKGLSELIRFSTTTNQEQLNYLEKIDYTIEAGNYIIRDLIELNIIQQAVLNLRMKDINMEELLRTLKDNFDPMAGKKEQKININTHVSKNIYTDKIHLERVLENLITNAIKYSPLRSSIHITAIEEDNKFILSVKDEGPGFTAADKEKVFGKFQKLSARPTYGESSTGLGLYIVKIMAERLQGTMELISEPGQGSEFILTLPCLKDRSEMHKDKL
ncbi:MAG: ATP-binding protein [Cyclobacteriaceae bacterium]|nr:ATP-binding protein [Cyclobacteriaceae bacterium]